MEGRCQLTAKQLMSKCGQNANKEGVTMATSHGSPPKIKELQHRFKSGNLKISRIGRQTRKNNFFLFSPKEPIWLTIFGNDIKRFDFLFLYSKFAKPENSATGPPTAATRLEIWHMFNTLVRTHQTSS